jgi:hypothetical protein
MTHFELSFAMLSVQKVEIDIQKLTNFSRIAWKHVKHTPPDLFQQPLHFIAHTYLSNGQEVSTFTIFGARAWLRARLAQSQRLQNSKNRLFIRCFKQTPVYENVIVMI